ncbi:MAG: efflux RND transporter periplasmic adaptor subunit [Bacteroidota bacterium]
MKLIHITAILLSALLFACGGPDKPQTLEGKKAALKGKKDALRTLTQEISSLEAEIAEMDPEAKAQVKVVPVSTKPVQAETFQHFVEVQGKVEANRNVMVSPQMAGRLTNIYVREGQQVRAGQLLAKVDDAIMRSSISEMKTQLDLANIMFEKQKNLWDQEIGTEIQFLTAKNQKESLEKRIATLDEQLALSKITAPLSGTVDKIMPKVGETVAPGMPAFQVVNNTDLSLVADLSESYIPYIRRGDIVKINFPALDKSINAKVSVVGQSIDPLARTFRIEVKLPNDRLLKANMFGEISINDRTRENALTVPMNLVQQSEVGPYVYIAEQTDGKWAARLKNIHTDLYYGGKFEFVNGLTAGDKLITVGFKGLSDGQEIRFDEKLANNETQP